MDRETEYPEGSLVYSIKENEAVLGACKGRFTSLVLPEYPFEGVKLTAIGKKAFLGKKTLRKLSVPSSVRSIGDFGFAHCSNLKELEMPLCEAGDGIFTGCTALEKVSFPGMSEDKAALFALSVRFSGPARLSDVGGLDEEWFIRFDAWISSFLLQPDDEGFTNQILCGEEEVGLSDRDAYMSGQRVIKASLCIQRLLHPEGMLPDYEKTFTEYIKDHRQGSEKGNESWLAVRDNYPDKAHFGILEKYGCVDDGNRPAMLKSLGDDKQELKSLLMKNAGNEAFDRFFSGLEI